MQAIDSMAVFRRSRRFPASRSDRLRRQFAQFGDQENL
jgi:hypothetical protein